MTAALDRQLKDLYPELLTAQEVADLLETTRTTVNNMRKRRQLGGIITPNGNVFFLKEEVEALRIKRQLQPPKTGRPRKESNVSTLPRTTMGVQSTGTMVSGGNGQDKKKTAEAAVLI